MFIVVGTIGTIAGTAIDDQSGVASVEVGIKNRDSGLWLQSDGTWGSKVYRQVATLDARFHGGELDGDVDPVGRQLRRHVVTKDAVGNEDPTRPWIMFTVTAGARHPGADAPRRCRRTTRTSGWARSTWRERHGNVGVTRPRVAIKNKTTNQWWNGSTWQSTFRGQRGAAWFAGCTSTSWSSGFVATAAATA